MALGATRRETDSYDAAQVTATELGALGINQNYAPVADVNIDPLNPVIGVRSFGESPDLVSKMTAAAVRGTEARRRLVHAEALPRPRRHSDRQPHRRALDFPHP